MLPPSNEVSRIMLDRVAEWLTRAALRGDSLEKIVCGFCDRLAATGMPLLRAHMSFSMLHPLYDALGFTWVRGRQMEVEGIRKSADGASERFTQSPYYYLFEYDLEHLRRRINPDIVPEFPVFEDLKALGATDYIAFRHSFDSSQEKGMIGSWATDHPSGFSDEMIAELLRLQSHLAMACKMAVLSKLADNMMCTYLGGEAGRRVLNGKIKRGEGDTIRAALVIADMRGSTKLAETAGREVYIDTLNQFFDAIATPFNRAGGQILSFLGDGFLALFPCERHRVPSEKACLSALHAAQSAAGRMKLLNEKRTAHGQDPINFGIGMNVGNVMFGNVGLSDRLTFSVFGSAVNEASRLQNLSKKYATRLIASKEFADYCSSERWKTIGEEKLAGLRSKVTVLTPEIASINEFDGAAIDREAVHMSDAERLILLHRKPQKVEDGEKNFQ
ncbi:MAG: adenylate/guanylate cyclase domain-containing protein [Rhizobiaceae bacterium]|nr:adenylate/guanylate cyclase domain-containing protein [Rhizobiaceae bacterium]